MVRHDTNVVIYLKGLEECLNNQLSVKWVLRGYRFADAYCSQNPVVRPSGYPMPGGQSDADRY